MTKSLKTDDFVSIWGMPRTAALCPHNFNLEYRDLSREERDAVILEILKKLDNDEFSVAGEQAKDRWNKGWEENLKMFKKNGHRLEDLIPKYYRKNNPARLYKDFIMPVDSWAFEVGSLTIFTSWLFKEYFSNVDVVYDFGCGTGMYLAQIAQLFPKKEFHGLDWIPAAAGMVDKIGEVYGWNMKGHIFDMFLPDKNFNLKAKSGVLLFSSLEQLGTNFGNFLDYIIAQKPDIVVTIDTFYEWYDEEHIADYLTKRFMMARNYLRGFIDELHRREKNGEVEIIKANPSPIGSLHIEGQSYIIWRPAKAEI